MTTPPPPPANVYDPTTITRATDQHGTTRLVNIPGYGEYTPDQLIACLEAQQALGQARADAAALEVQLEATREQLELWERCQNENVFRMLINQRDTARDQTALVEQELAALKARMPCLEAAAGAEVLDEQYITWRRRAYTTPAGTPEDVFEYALKPQQSYRFAVAFSLVKETQRRLVLQMVHMNTASATTLQAFVEAKRIAGIDRDGWYIENFAIEGVPHDP